MNRADQKSNDRGIKTDINDCDCEKGKLWTLSEKEMMVIGQEHIFQEN